MDLSNFYLICFIVGLVLSFFSFLVGAIHIHLPFDWHLDGVHHHAGDLPHLHTDLGGSLEQTSGVQHITGGAHASPLNFSTIMAFLAWFGGAGYLLTRYYQFWFLLVFGMALLSGLTGAAIVFYFLVKVLLRGEQDLNPADYDLTGVIAYVSSPIREGGTGEIIFSQAGTRKTSGARSEDDKAIPKGAQVVIIRYEKGLAYVKRWEDLIEE